MIYMQVRYFGHKTSRGVYRITYSNGYIYIGSFVNSTNHIVAVSYLGSSTVAHHYNWSTKEFIKLFEVFYLPEELRFRQSKIESFFIRIHAANYGIADCAALLSSNNSFLSKYPKHGLLLNLHCNTCDHLLSPEVRTKAISNIDYNKIVSVKLHRYGKSLGISKESRLKAVKTRRTICGFNTPESIQKMLSTTRKNNSFHYLHLQTPESLSKAAAVRRCKGYKESAVKVAKSIRGKPHFIPKPIRYSTPEVTITFQSIKDAETYLNLAGVRITRATISQGLLRTKGNYTYKAIHHFEYL